MNNLPSSGGLLELRRGSEDHQLRIDLNHGVVIVALVAWDAWHPDTRQEPTTQYLIYSVEPDGRIVGIRTQKRGRSHG